MTVDRLIFGTGFLKFSNLSHSSALGVYKSTDSGEVQIVSIVPLWALVVINPGLNRKNALVPTSKDDIARVWEK